MYKCIQYRYLFYCINTIIIYNNHNQIHLYHVKHKTFIFITITMYKCIQYRDLFYCIISNNHDQIHLYHIKHKKFIYGNQYHV